MTSFVTTAAAPATDLPAAGIAVGATVENRAASAGLSETDAATAYYGRTADKFGAWNRSLCNKCHNKD